MSFFRKSKKANPEPQETKASAPTQAGSAGVLVLGGGCAKCNQLEAAAREALAELHMDDSIGHITDFGQIASYGVMSTPALMIDGKVVSSGRVLKKDEVAALLRKARQAQ